MDKNYVLDWIKQYFHKTEINEELLKPIYHFSLLWNLFEFTYFTDSMPLRLSRLKDLSIISANNVSDDILNSTFDFFKKRYFPNNEIADCFETLKLEDADYKFSKNAFLIEDTNKEDKVKCTFLIIHRFRNNLFHGCKSPELLGLYEQPFQIINQFLMHFINNTSDQNNINKNRFPQ
jgi:hypothetical protein